MKSKQVKIEGKLFTFLSICNCLVSHNRIFLIRFRFSNTRKEQAKPNERGKSNKPSKMSTGIRVNEQEIKPNFKQTGAYHQQLCLLELLQQSESKALHRICTHTRGLCLVFGQAS